MPISSALLEAVQVIYNQDLLDEVQLKVHQEQGPLNPASPVDVEQKKEPENSDIADEEVSPEMLVAQYLIQLAFSGENPENRDQSEVHTGEFSSDSTYYCSCCCEGWDENAEESMFPWFKEVDQSLHLDEFFSNASATSTPKKESYDDLRQPRDKQQSIRL